MPGCCSGVWASLGDLQWSVSHALGREGGGERENIINYIFDRGRGEK